MNKAIRVYLLSFYGRAGKRLARRATSRYVVAAADDAAAVETAVRLHAEMISRSALAELANDKNAQVASWTDGIGPGLAPQAPVGTESRAADATAVQWGGSKASHWAQTLSFMFRMVRVASISGR